VAVERERNPHQVAVPDRRFAAPRTPYPGRWLADNGSVFAAAKTIGIAPALNLQPCFTPVESPESNGVAEAFVKTFKRDYVRVSPIPDAQAALAAVSDWMTHLQRGPPPQQARLPLTKGIHQNSTVTRRVSGLTGSTPVGGIDLAGSPSTMAVATVEDLQFGSGRLPAKRIWRPRAQVGLRSSGSPCIGWGGWTHHTKPRIVQSPSEIILRFDRAF
jgi:hypothetical protein